MDLARRDISITLALAVISLFIFSPFWQHVEIFYFAPFLITFLYQNKLKATVWAALLCGFTVDLFLDQRFGVSALIYVMAVTFLFHQKKHFFSDHISTLPLMSGFFALLVWLFFLASYWDNSISIKAIIINSLAIFFSNALYAFLVFLVPFLLVNKRRPLFLILYIYVNINPTCASLCVSVPSCLCVLIAYCTL